MRKQQRILKRAACFVLMTAVLISFMPQGFGRAQTAEAASVKSIRSAAALRSALTSSESGAYRLSADISGVTKAIVVKSKTKSLDLNGYSVKGKDRTTGLITVKGGKFLEAVAAADTIVFDKTGTLTKARPQVADVVVFNGMKKDELLRIAACLEEHFPHSMANAVVQAARERDLAHEEMHSQVEYLVAHGIASTVDGRRVIIGSAHFVFEDEGCTVPPGEQAAFDTLPKQYSHLYLAVGGVLAAVICISDPLRAEAADAVAALHSLGVGKIVMLTGDSERTAAAIAAQVGVDEYRAEVLPEDKAHFVQAERSQGRTVVMIGDGVNDSPALSAANVGIAISDGAAIAREIADITIAANDLFELVQLRRLSMALMNRIQSNYRFVIGFNGGLIALGALGVLAPATSATLHNLSTLGISLRSMTSLLPPAKA